jgi:hypothetical protein
MDDDDDDEGREEEEEATFLPLLQVFRVTKSLFMKPFVILSAGAARSRENAMNLSDITRRIATNCLSDIEYVFNRDTTVTVKKK